MKIISFFLVITCLLLCAGCGALEENKQIDPWRLVPRHAAVVVELHSYSRFDSLLHLFDARLATCVKSVSYSNVERPSFYQVIHRIGQRDMSLFLFPVQHSRMDSIQRLLLMKREFEGVEIRESIKPNRLSFATVDGVGMLSQDALIIEESIRQLKNESASFRDVHPALYQFPGLKNDGGNIYLNWPEFTRNQATQKLIQSTGLPIEKLLGTLVSDFRKKDSALLLSGFATDSAERNGSMLDGLTNQQPVKIELTALVPDRFRSILHLGLSSPVAWFDRNLRVAKPDELKRMDSLSLIGLSSQEISKSMDNEALVFTIDEGPVAVVELKEVTRVMRAIDKTSRKLVGNGKADEETFGEFRITRITHPDVASLLFGGWLPRSQETYFSLGEDFLLIAVSDQAIKAAIREISNDNTIGRSIEWGRFFASSQQESNLSVFVNATDPFATDSLPGQWQDLSKLSIQFTKLDRHFYASAHIQFNEQRQRDRVVGLTSTESDSPVRSDLFSVVNHETRELECLYQDAAGRIQLMNLNGQVLWQKQIDGPIAGNVHQVDLLKNGKLQFLFLANHKLYAVDRLGRVVDGFPVDLQDSEAKWLSVVDYNNTKDYRFVVSSDAGRITITDKKGKALDGWNPKSTKESLSAPPLYTRVQKKDYFLTGSTTGKLMLFNRRGEQISGFPVATRMIPSGSYATFNNQFVMVSEDGHLLNYDTRGIQKKDEVLLKEDVQAKFVLVRDELSERFIIARIERAQLGFFDAEGSLLFDVANPASEKIRVEYLETDKHHGVVLIYDEEQQLSFLFSRSGKQLFSQPLETSSLPGMAYLRQKRELVVFYSMGSLVKTLRITL